MDNHSEIDKITLDIFQEHGGITTITEKLRVDDGVILLGSNPVIEVSHQPSGICFIIDEYPEVERNKLVGVRILKNRLSQSRK